MTCKLTLGGMTIYNGEDKHNVQFERDFATSFLLRHVNISA